ncbi:MAG: hypothetical protein ACRCXD_14570 [Luteolibacter sp.]
MKQEMRIGFSRTWKPFSLLIQAVTFSRMSHMYVVMETPFEESIVYHAHGHAVSATNAKEFYKKNVVVAEFEFKMTETDRFAVMKFILSNLGKAYSFLQNVGMLWVLVGRLFKRTWSNPFANGESSWNCSELGARVLKMENPEDKSPSDVYAEIKSRGLGTQVA